MRIRGVPRRPALPGAYQCVRPPDKRHGCPTRPETYDGSYELQKRLEAPCGVGEDQVVLDHAFDPPARQTVREVEDRDLACLREADGLHRAAGAVVPAEDEAHRRLEVGPEHLMAVAGVQ